MHLYSCDAEFEFQIKIHKIRKNTQSKNSII
jgi:hypothetical protein